MLLYMKQHYYYLLFIIIFIIIFLIIDYPATQEGFNTYFRQTIRPHVRTFRNAHNNVTYHFNQKFKDFGRNLGFW